MCEQCGSKDKETKEFLAIDRNDVETTLSLCEDCVKYLQQEEDVLLIEMIQVRLHNALNNLLNLWIANFGWDWSIVDECLEVLAYSNPYLPISLVFSKNVMKLREKLKK